ncbi:SAM-dependent methyltransferase, partial [Bacillus cereus]
MSELEKEIKLLPPPELDQYVGGDFEKVGKEFLNHFIQIGALKSNEKVLDVGCGVGRMAVPLM